MCATPIFSEYTQINMRFLLDCYKSQCEHCQAFSSCIISAIGQDNCHKATRELHYLSCQDGETVFQQGEQVRGLYILSHGWIKLHLATKEGRNLLVKICTTGDLLTGITLYAHAFSAVSTRSATVRLIGKSQVVQLIEQYPSLGLEIDH